MRKQLRGFLDFIREQGIIALAIGLAMGTQITATVTAIVNGLINPIVGFILGGSNLSEYKWEVISGTQGGRELTLYWGAVLNAVIQLVAVAAVIYFLVRGLKLDKLDKKKDEK